MGIVEEAIVLLFLYFSTSAPTSRRPDLALYILSSLDFFHSISSIIIRDEVQYLLGLYRPRRRKEKENREKKEKKELSEDEKR